MFLKKCISSVVCSLMGISVSLFVANAEKNEAVYSHDDASVAQIVSSIEAKDIKTNSNDLWLTDAFDVYIFPDEGKAINGNAYFLIDNTGNSIIAEFDVFEDNTVVYTDVSELGFSDYYKADKAFAIGFDENNYMTVISESGDFFSTFEDTNIDGFRYEVKKAQPVYPIKFSNRGNKALVAQLIFNDGNCIANATNPDFNGSGLCWAASIGSKINWEKNYNFTSAVAVYNYVKYTIYGGGSLLGYDSVIEGIIDYIYNSSYSTTSSATAGFVYNGLCVNRRTVACLDSTVSGASGHTVLINGISAKTTGISLYVKDSNTPSIDRIIAISTLKSDGTYMNPTEVMTLPMNFQSNYYSTPSIAFNGIHFCIY